ncbi:MAG: hypothetical protein KME23_08085 [Goleter apudmare HA4340-LM2]|nr:hypothetical protein [Goleter apudmare HA4340-LM2]
MITSVKQAVSYVANLFVSNNKPSAEKIASDLAACLVDLLAMEVDEELDPDAMFRVDAATELVREAIQRLNPLTEKY